MANEPIYSGPTELTWTGDGTRYVPGVPARDLSDYDIDRIVYRRTAGTQEGTSSGLQRGGTGFDEYRANVIVELTRDGLYAVATSTPAPVNIVPKVVPILAPIEPPAPPVEKE